MNETCNCALCVSSDVTIEQLIGTYSDASMAAALARGTPQYDDAMANAAAARNALIAEIERLREALHRAHDYLSQPHG